LRELTRAEVRELLARPEELVAVWPDATGDRLDVIVPRHLEREGFRFVAEHDEDGRLAGLAYGYRGEAGQWWHDLVAEAMDEQARAHWLAPGHFELVELAVRPDLHRRGIGGRLHDALLEVSTHRPQSSRPRSTTSRRSRSTAAAAGRSWCRRSTSARSSRRSS
jgi:ribosomal protein S18 acetylase RimI-like enzyme